MTKPITDRPLKRAGRKSEYDEEIAIEVCVRMMEGRTLKEVCEDQDMPAVATVYRWLTVQPTFREAYSRAREAQMERWGDDIVEIADDTSQDYVDREVADGSNERVYDPEAVQRSKLRINTRQWLMARLAASRYGGKVDVNVSRQDEIENLSDAELVARTRARLEALGIEVPTNTLLLGYDETAGQGDDDEPEPEA